MVRLLTFDGVVSFLSIHPYCRVSPEIELSRLAEARRIAAAIAKLPELIRKP
jgi:hypothetical protein